VLKLLIYLKTLHELCKMYGDEERMEINSELVRMEEKWSWSLSKTHHIPGMTDG
jgi:hypothetical protein